MRNHIKIIFFDIDGTLIDMERKVISERTVETLLPSAGKRHQDLCSDRQTAHFSP